MSALLKEQIDIIRQRIAEAARASGRPASAVRLMAVTKTVDDRRIMQAIDAGVDMIGENYVQEARRKIELMGKSVEWHLIGHLQTNKAKYAVRLFDMIHSLDRIELAHELDKRSRMAGVVTKVLVEVNISGEETKRGVPHRDALPLILEVSALENISVQGLMTMPPWFDDPEEARPSKRGLRRKTFRASGCRSFPWACPKTIRWPWRKAPRSCASAAAFSASGKRCDDIKS
jgi:pyridoxal phosphate enzyme (YggS family)